MSRFGICASILLSIIIVAIMIAAPYQDTLSPSFLAFILTIGYVIWACNAKEVQFIFKGIWLGVVFIGCFLLFFVQNTLSYYIMIITSVALIAIIISIPARKNAKIILATFITSCFMGSIGVAGLIAIQKGKLFSAISAGDISTIKQLVNEGFDVNQPNRNGETPLLYAFRIFETRRSRQSLPEHLAVMTHEEQEQVTLNVCQILVDAGADVDYSTEYLSPSIYLAASKNYNEVVRFLAKSGANVKVGSSYDRRNTPLHYVVAQNDIDTVQLLLDNGADPTVTNKQGLTPLDIATKKNYKSILELFQLYLDKSKNEKGN